MENLNKATRSFRIALLVIGGFSFFAALLQLTIPLYMLQIYDRVLPSNSHDTLIFISILAGFALIILGITEMIRQFLGNRAAAKFDTWLSTDVLEEVVKNGQKTGGNTQYLKDLQSVRQLVGSKILTGLVDLPFSTVFVICLYFIHPHLFYLTIVGVVVLILIALANRSFAAASTKEQNAAAMHAGTEAEFFARNSDSILAMGMLKDVVAVWGEKNATALVAGDRSSAINSLFSGVSRTIRFGLQAMMLGYGAWLVQKGEMTAGMIFASSILSGRALQPIDVVINSWPQISSGKAAWGRVKEFIAETNNRHDYTDIQEPEGHLAVAKILQKNPVDGKAPPILARVSFDLPAGISLAIIGASGSGKSTLARVITGALKPFAGVVRIDGHEIVNWNPQDLGKYIGYLAQDVELLPGTIAQNISRFRGDATADNIHKAAKMAHVQELIKKMPHGFDTRIGPGGVTISGGEKQRIALARAFYGSPKLLVLDEPNSSLDKSGEAALLRALKAAKEESITVILITQRDNILKSVDRIMQMKDGKIVEYRDRDDFFQRQVEKLELLKQKHQQAAVEQAGQLQKAKSRTDG